MILQGNVTDKLQEIEAESIQCVVTSPPYWGLRDYGTATWEGGDEDCDHQENVQFSNKSSIRDTSKNNVIEENKGKGIYYKDICKKCGAKRIDEQLGLEETPEEYVEKMVDIFRGIKRVLKKDGTVWLNLGDTYHGGGGGNYGNGVSTSSNHNQHLTNVRNRVTIKGLKSKDLVGIPWRVALALQSDGWYLRQDIIWHKPNPMPESVTDRCTKSHEYIFLLTKSAKYYYDADAIREPSTDPESFNGRRKRTMTDLYKKTTGHANTTAVPEGKTYEMRNKRDVWTINTKPYKDAHFAVFPQKLPELCIKAGSKEGDMVLDPFFGSGTTGYVAHRLGRKWVGIELNPEYIKIAEKRFAQQDLFAV